MKKRSFIKKLQERGMLYQITDKEYLAQRLSQKPIALYCGFDPTSDSLHLGHLIPLFCLKRFQLAGHKPVALIGGCTGLIGDPSFKSEERKLNKIEKVNQWVEKIRKQVSIFLDFNCGSNSAIIANNYDWFSSMNVPTFLRDIGKNFSVNKMIKKETVKQRIHINDRGISFTEFSYNLLQGFDFSELYKRYQVELQIGGSDQWGNITSGIDLTRRLYKKNVLGMTMPLIKKSDGTKFGKTELDVVWLSKEKTSSYKFYQFWRNTSDDEVYYFLKLFTFMDIEAIHAIEKKESSKAPSAQYILAEEVTRMVHGKEGLAAAKRITRSLFFGKFQEMTKSDFSQLLKDGIPKINLKHDTDLQQALVTADLVNSRGQARIIIISKAVTINGKKNYNPKYTFSERDRIFGRYTLLRRGKKNYCLIDWNSPINKV